MPPLEAVIILFALVVIVLLVVIVVQVVRPCRCPVDQAWLDQFNKWQTAQGLWEDAVYAYFIRIQNDCLPEGCLDQTEENPPGKPCKFGTCT